MTNRTDGAQMPPRAHSIAEARKLLGGISQATIYGLIRRGELRTFHIGRRRCVSSAAIADYISSAEGQTEAA